MGDYVCINTKIIDKDLALLKMKNQRLEYLLWQYDIIVETVNREWKGKAADSFVEDAKGIRKKLGTAEETIQLLADTIAECREVIDACDKGLGAFNRDPDAE